MDEAVRFLMNIPRPFAIWPLLLPLPLRDDCCCWKLLEQTEGERVWTDGR